MSDLVGNPEDRFSRVAARIVFNPEIVGLILGFSNLSMTLLTKVLSQYVIMCLWDIKTQIFTQ